MSNHWKNPKSSDKPFIEDTWKIYDLPKDGLVGKSCPGEAKEERAAWGSDMREVYYYKLLLQTGHIPLVILNIWYPCYFFFLSSVGILG